MIYAGEGEGQIFHDFAKNPMSGTIVKVFCKVGDKIKAGEPLISVESMKMEFLVKADRDVTI